MPELTPRVVFDCDFFFSSRRRHTRLQGDWSSDVCSSDLKSYVVLRYGCSRRYFSFFCCSFFARRAKNEQQIGYRPRIFSFCMFFFHAPGKKEKIGRASCREKG